MDLETLRARREAVLGLCARHGAVRVRVFGSVARGEAREGSDLDLLVVFEEGRTLLDHARLKLALEGLLGVPVDVVSEGGLAPRLRERVLREAVPL
ncbi:nucleotidyltransferase family protein [Thermus sp.]|jgi:predicted nucleotidyltransferase